MDRQKLETLLDGCVPLVYKNVTGSTNDDAKQLVRDGCVPVLVVAGRQTGGRGRRGNSFLSPEGGIYMTLAMSEPRDTSTLELLTSFVGVCVCEALEEVHGLEAGIKWVNDVYVDGCKLAGILVERVTSVLAIGVGINVHEVPKLNDSVRATALAEYVRTPCAEVLCANIARRLVAYIRDGIDAESTVATCRERSVLLGHKVCFVYEGSMRYGIASDVDDDGALIVQIGEEFVRLTSAAHEIRLVE